MFKARLLSGISIIVVLLLFGMIGGDLLLAGLGVISIVGQHELYRVFQLKNGLLTYVGYAATVILYIVLKLNSIGIGINLLLVAMLFLVVLMAVYVFAYPKYKADEVAKVFFGLFYVALMLSYVYQTRMLPKGLFLVWLIFLCSWGCDTCAYCFGMLFGKHKMAPILSPKKSVEGAIGGVIGAAVLTIIYGFSVKNAMGISVGYIFVLAAICTVGALISMVGDLAASAIKRNYDVKDYGKWIPGHGGVLDRFDSVIFTAPIIYFLALYLI